MDNRKNLLLGVFVVLFCTGVLYFSGQFSAGTATAGADVTSVASSRHSAILSDPRWNILFTAGFAVFAVFSFMLLVRSFRGTLPAGVSSPLTPCVSAFAVIFVFFVLTLAIPGMRSMLMMMLADISGVCQLILLILVVGLLLNFGHFIFLNREFMSFVSLKQHLDQLDSTDSDYLDKVERILDNETHGILKGKWRSLKAIFRHLDRADFATVMSFSDIREDLKEAKILFIIRLLPLLGLIGTVMGFVMAVVGMQQAAVNMVDFSSFKGNMLNALGGMRYAFLTTLGGMVGMVLVMMVNSLIGEARKRLLLLEDEFFYLHIFVPYVSASGKEDREDRE